MGAFNESFVRSFEGTFPTGVEMGREGYNNAALMRQQQEADSAIAETFKMLEQTNADRIGGFEQLGNIRTVTNALPAARKAATQYAISAMQNQGVTPSEPFKSWLSSAKPEEVNAVLDQINDMASTDPNFGQQSIIDMISDPAKFSQIITQFSAPEEGGDAASSSGQQSAAIRGINSEIGKISTDLTRKQTELNTLNQALTQAGSASKGMQKRLEIAIKQKEGEISQLSKRKETLDSRRFDLENKDQNWQVGQMYRNGGDQAVSVRYNDNTGEVVDLQGRPVKMQDGDVLRQISDRPRQQEMIQVNSDGTVSIARGGDPAAMLTNSQRGTILTNFRNDLVAANNFNQLSNEMIADIQSNPGVSGIVSAVSRAAGEVFGGAKNILEAVDNLTQSGYSLDPSVELDPNSYEWGALSAESAEFKTKGLMLALQFAVASGMGEGRTLSNQDVQRAVDTLQLSTNDPGKFVSSVRAAQRVNRRRLENISRSWPEIISFDPEKDLLDYTGDQDFSPTQKRPDAAAPESAAPSGWEDVWADMLPEERQKVIDSVGQ